MIKVGVHGRFLISFMGRYLSHDFYVSSSCGKTEGASGFIDHQLLKISVPRTEPDFFGPAFVEVELPSFSSFLYNECTSTTVCCNMMLI